MAEPTTQAEIDALLNKYFILDDGSDWPTNTKSSALAQGYLARVASLSQNIQDDIVDLCDAGTQALA